MKMGEAFEECVLILAFTLSIAHSVRLFSTVVSLAPRHQGILRLSFLMVTLGFRKFGISPGLSLLHIATVCQLLAHILDLAVWKIWCRISQVWSKSTLIHASSSESHFVLTDLCLI